MTLLLRVFQGEGKRGRSPWTVEENNIICIDRLNKDYTIIFARN